MSRFFNGGTAADSITFSIGSAPTAEHPITIAVLLHASTASFLGWAIQGANGSSGSWSMLTASGPMFMENDFTSGGPTLSTGWCWYVVTKASSSATPRWHVHDLTAATAWSHTNGSGSVTSPAVTANKIIVGGDASGAAGDSWRGRIAAAATWSSVLTDLQIEAACTLLAADLLAAAPSWMIRLNQASTATSVTDDTGNGGNQTAISGTAVDADEPPGWSYSLTQSSVSQPMIVSPPPPPLPAARPVLARNTAALIVPPALGVAPLVVSQAPPVPAAAAFVRRSTLIDPPVLTTASPTVVTAPVPPRPGAVLLLQNPQPAAAPVSGPTTAPIVVTAAPGPPAALARTLRAHLQDAIVATPQPQVVTYPAAVPAGLAVVVRTPPAAAATPGPYVVTQPAPPPAAVAPFVARGSLADFYAGTKPLVVGSASTQQLGAVVLGRNSQPASAPVIQPRTPTITVDLARVAVATDASRTVATADLTRPSVRVSL